MIIFQKNFNTPVRNNYVEQVPEAEKQTPDWMTPYASYAKKPDPKPQEPDENALLQSAMKKKNSHSYFERNSLSPQEQEALDKYTEKLRTDSAEQALNKVKEKASNTLGKLSENYGELTGGRSLGKDAALAAGGLALAGGAYHLLKKRRDKKKAEKEALENRIKK